MAAVRKRNVEGMIIAIRYEVFYVCGKCKHQNFQEVRHGFHKGKILKICDNCGQPHNLTIPEVKE